MKQLKLYLLLLIALLLVIFLIQNAEAVELHFLAWSFQTRRAFLVLGMLAVGILAGWILKSLRVRSAARITAGEPSQPPAPTESKPPQG